MKKILFLVLFLFFMSELILGQNFDDFLFNAPLRKTIITDFFLTSAYVILSLIYYPESFFKRYGGNENSAKISFVSQQVKSYIRQPVNLNITID